MPCVKRLYNGSALLVTRKAIFQFMFMQAPYPYLCRVEEFNNPKDDL
ncbi:MAG: hypothetical protein M3270_06935 [Thermoproteota archaeon]|nr:hypothetical protein [Thermoproteota archaeon]